MSDYKVSRVSFEVNNMPTIDYPNENYNFISGIIMNQMLKDLVKLK